VIGIRVTGGMVAKMIGLSSGVGEWLVEMNRADLGSSDERRAAADSCLSGKGESWAVVAVLETTATR
jgi:hypothetical protein